MDKIIKDEQYIQIKEALRHLTNEQRTAFELKYVYDLKYKEIADIIGISPNAVKKLLQRTRVKIKDKIKK